MNTHFLPDTKNLTVNIFSDTCPDTHRFAIDGYGSQCCTAAWSGTTCSPGAVSCTSPNGNDCHDYDAGYSPSN